MLIELSVYGCTDEQLCMLFELMNNCNGMVDYTIEGWEYDMIGKAWNSREAQNKKK